MSDLLFMSGAGFIIFMCIAAMLGLLVYTIIEFTKDSCAPTWVKCAVVIFLIAFLTMLAGLVLKIAESL